MISGLVAAAAKFISGANVRWVGCIPERKQRIYFANHTSHFDALVLWSALPPELRQTVRPVAAHDYWTKTKTRLYLATKVFHAVLIERERVSVSNNPLEALVAALNDGASLIIFPEGTRSSGEIQSFKSGLYHIARKRPDVELVPVHIDNMNRILPKGEVLPVPLLSCISFGTPLFLREGENKAEFLMRAQHAVKELKQL